MSKVRRKKADWQCVAQSSFSSLGKFDMPLHLEGSPQNGAGVKKNDDVIEFGRKRKRVISACACKPRPEGWDRSPEEARIAFNIGMRLLGPEGREKVFHYLRTRVAPAEVMLAA